jgi:hypothetical protein
MLNLVLVVAVLEGVFHNLPKMEVCSQEAVVLLAALREMVVMAAGQAVAVVAGQVRVLALVV